MQCSSDERTKCSALIVSMSDSVHGPTPPAAHDPPEQSECMRECTPHERADVRVSFIQGRKARGVGMRPRSTKQRRALGDRIAFSPPLIISEAEIDAIFDRFAAALNETADWITSQC